MEPRIEISKEMKLVGKRLKMSFADYKVVELWRSFMPYHNKISNRILPNLISMAVYPPSHFEEYKPTNEFEKWATVEVSDFKSVPGDMEPFLLKSGLYAVFDYKGSNENNGIYKYIFGTWLPHSDYTLDDRPHFEILGDKYKNNDPTSEEEIWVPIKPKP
jgi:AraC family transcriptional regulator